jgi:hypothetical protein
VETLFSPVLETEVETLRGFGEPPPDSFSGADMVAQNPVAARSLA